MAESNDMILPDNAKAGGMTQMAGVCHTCTRSLQVLLLKGAWTSSAARKRRSLNSACDRAQMHPQSVGCNAGFVTVPSC